VASTVRQGVLNWHDEYELFAARKTKAALAALLPPYRTELNHADSSLIAIGSEWTSHLFDGAFYLSPPPDPHRPACSLVFVQSHDGNTGAADPSTLGGGKTDQHLIYEGLSRVAADAILAGAGTIRDGGQVLSVWRPELVGLRASLGKPRHPVQIVATLRALELDRVMLFNVPEVRVVVVTVPSGAAQMASGLAARPWIASVVMNSAEQLPEAFEQIRALGIERISAIGGRHLAAELIDAGLVQDIYLTTSPRKGGESNTPMYPKALPGDVILRKSGTEQEDGVVFEHIVMAPASLHRP